MTDYWWEVIDPIQSVLDGMMFGSIYALIGIGFTLIFGVMHKINLAYAAASIGGAYASLAAFQLLSAPALAVFLCAAAASGVIGYIVYICCFRFIPEELPLATLMASVGMLILIDEVIVHATAGMPEPYPAMFDDVMIDLEPFWIRGDLLMIFAISVVAKLVLLYILYRDPARDRDARRRPAALGSAALRHRAAANQCRDLHHHLEPSAGWPARWSGPPSASCRRCWPCRSRSRG